MGLMPRAVQSGRARTFQQPAGAGENLPTAAARVDAVRHLRLRPPHRGCILCRITASVLVRLSSDWTGRTRIGRKESA